MSMPDTPDLAQHDTLPKLLRWRAQNRGDQVALREKEFGVWQEYNWQDYHNRTRQFALGFRALGLGEGDVVGLIGDSRPDWVAAAIAAHAVRAMSLGIYQDSLDPEVEYLINYAGARVIVAEDEEQVDKILNLSDSLDTVEFIVYCDGRGMRKYDDPRLLSREALFEKADALAQQQPGLYDELVDATGADDCAVLCTTSGTTSNPKLAMLSAGGLIRHVDAYARIVPSGPGDEYVSVLPMPWIGELFYALFQPLVCGNRLNFVEEPDTMMADMREIGPNFVLFAPRVWEQIAADVRARMLDASPFKRMMFDFAMNTGLKAAGDGGTSGLARVLLFRALKDRLGLNRLNYAATGGAALGPDNFKFFNALGVKLLQVYGQTEMLGVYCMHKPDDIDTDTVGVPFSDEYKVEINNPDKNGVGEIIASHPNMFLGYYKDEAATKDAIIDGWMHTGDAGYFNDRGHLVVIDRIKDIATTSGGDRFSPQFIENKLKFSPYIAEAVILGNERPHVAAIICIRMAIMSKWAEKNGIAYTTYSDLSGRDEVYDIVRREVETVNAQLPAPQRIRKFVLLYKELDADDGELTRTRKVRRGVIGEKYGDIISAIYSDVDAVDIDTVISFQDGSQQRIQTTLKVAQPDTGGEMLQAAE